MTQPTAAMVEALTNMLDTTAAIREATMGYRASLIADGWNEAPADQMAVQFHSMLIDYLRPNAEIR